MSGQRHFDDVQLLRDVMEHVTGVKTYTTLPEFARWWYAMGKTHTTQTLKDKILRNFGKLFSDDENPPVKFKLERAPVYVSNVLQLWAHSINASIRVSSTTRPDIEVKAEVPVLAASLVFSVNTKNHKGIGNLTSKQIEDQDCEALKFEVERILDSVKLDRFNSDIFKVSDVIVMKTDSTSFMQFAITAEYDYYPRNVPNVVSSDALWALFDHMKKHGFFESYKFYSVGISCHAITDDKLRIPHVIGGFDTHTLLYGKCAYVEVVSPPLMVEKGGYPSFKLSHKRGVHVKYEDAVPWYCPTFATEVLQHGHYTDCLPHIVLLEYTLGNSGSKCNVVSEDGTRFYMSTHAFTVS